MGWIQKAFWFLIFIFVVVWLVWLTVGNSRTENEPAQKKESPQRSYSLLGKGWVSGSLFSFGTSTREEPTSYFKDTVSFSDAGGAGESDPNKEYVEIKASPWNKDIIIVSGWSLKTSSGKIIEIGYASDMPRRGAVNEEGLIALLPGDRLAVISGRSPLGVSFRENVCSGYLEQFQDFSPPILLSCPNPSIDMAGKNLSVEPACVAFIAGMNTCETPLTGFPGDISQECFLFAQTDLTYNGCVSLHQNDLFFFKDLWRFYARENEEVWNNKGGVIRLYDADKKLVDSLLY